MQTLPLDQCREVTRQEVRSNLNIAKGLYRVACKSVIAAYPAYKKAFERRRVIGAHYGAFDQARLAQKELNRALNKRGNARHTYEKARAIMDACRLSDLLVEYQGRLFVYSHREVDACYFREFLPCSKDTQYYANTGYSYSKSLYMGV